MSAGNTGWGPLIYMISLQKSILQYGSSSIYFGFGSDVSVFISLCRAEPGKKMQK